ncbi:MAG TPA: uracil-DNA glycosylase family protein [Actinomycetota bacterium]|nr:uracil-DNA glycosylase family protein [Actinomycetota bacterium]
MTGAEGSGDVGDPTLAVYEARAADWAAERTAAHPERASALAARSGDGPVVDLGCGPGWHLPHLGPDAIALDGARAMLDLVPGYAPVPRVHARLDALPFRRSALAGAWASKSYVHLGRPDVPLALADLHRALAVGAPADLTLFGGDVDAHAFADDPFAGRRFSGWPETMLRDVLVGGGFTVDDLEVEPRADGIAYLLASVRRARTLPDTVGAGMRLLVCGLNPSIYSADVGTGFARPGNRYWPAALAAGLVSRDRDTRHALVAHGIGMTDLVKRATPRADALTTDEYRAGVERIERLVRWLQPGAVVMVGLAGWRAAVDRKAVAGIQPEPFGNRPVYVMPSTSGLNASSRLDDLTDHLRQSAALADQA